MRYGLYQLLHSKRHYKDAKYGFADVVLVGQRKIGDVDTTVMYVWEVKHCCGNAEKVDGPKQLSQTHGPPGSRVAISPGVILESHRVLAILAVCGGGLGDPLNGDEGGGDEGSGFGDWFGGPGALFLAPTLPASRFPGGAPNTIETMLMLAPTVIGVSNGACCYWYPCAAGFRGH